ncbi:glycosyltransferase [Alkalispirochaeta alkalica]|uniref:glycosyltransferase n=1 Tax=Alkalispirochaeta alkalica TaxID=46356 RepID=UPI00036D7F21|nr:glycosyltransferase [Alkalispirochaeta alkalica]
MESSPFLSLVIPSLNGSARLARLLPRLRSVLAREGGGEVIIVDDGSDAVHRAALAALAGAALTEATLAGEVSLTGVGGVNEPGQAAAGVTGEPGPRVRLVMMPRRTGQIGATLAGVAAARGELVVTLDDDGAHPPEVIPRLRRRLEEVPGCALVYGVPRRKARGIRGLGTRLNSLLFHLFLGLPWSIPVGSFRMIRRELLVKALNRPVAFPYLSAMLLQFRPVTAAVRYGDARGSREIDGSASSYTLRRLLRVYGSLFLYWGPLRSLGRVLRPPRRSLPRLMVLGGGSSQLGILARARREGFSVVLADQAENPPGRGLADYFVRASTFDPRAVSRAARALRVSAIVAAGSDQPVYTAALASRELGLPCALSPGTALMVTNKFHMKERFRNAGIPTVPWAVLGEDPARWDQEGLARLAPPWVVKPLDSQGQRGIAIVHDRRELLEHRPRALAFSREKAILVEEYYPSREVTLSGWVPREGDPPEIWAITDRITFPPDPAGGQGLGVCLAHRYPSCFARDREKEIGVITGKITRAFGLGGVPLYFQFLLGDDGVRVNEIACRLGGAYEDISLPPVTGVDVLGRQLGWFQTALGLPRQEEPVLPQGAFCAVPLIFARPGRVVRYRGEEELLKLPGVEACRFLLPAGTVIAPRSNSTQRIAFAVLRGSSRREVNLLVDRLFETLRAENARGENLLIDTRGDIQVHSGV